MISISYVQIIHGKKGENVHKQVNKNKYGDL